MSTATETIESLVKQEYKYGFYTDVETESAPPGLNEEIIRLISAKKKEPEWMTEWRLRAYRHWLTMTEPTWQFVKFPTPDFQDIIYYSAPKQAKDAPKSLDEVIRNYSKPTKTRHPLRERERLAGVAVDAVFDSVSVGTTYQKQLAEKGIIFCSMSEAIQKHPALVQQYLGSVVPYTDNFYASLNSAVFTDGSFCYIPKGVRCPMELSTYFRINAAKSGQFERTLIIADEGGQVSYLEGCTAPMRDENQLHAAVVELVALDNAQIKSRTVQNWYPGDEHGVGGIYNFVTKRGCAGQEFAHHMDAGRDRLGDHLEISQLCFARGQLEGRVLFRGGHQQPPAGGHRHEDDSHRPEHAQHHRFQGHFRRPQSEQLPRFGENPEERRPRAEFFTMRLDAHRREVRGAHVPLHRGEEHDGFR